VNNGTGWHGMSTKTARERFLQRHGDVCDVCGGTGAEPLHWYDERHPERPRKWLAICRHCRTRPYAERLNRLHQMAWEARGA
jgi:hypothetical protein